MIRICLLCENYAGRRKMLAEHGLSIWIDTGNKKILFDTGQTDIFSINAINSGIDISKVDMAVLSHGHYDHTGGVPRFFRMNKLAPVYIDQEAFQKRYNGNGEARMNIGIPWLNENYSDAYSKRLVISNGKLELDDNIIILGKIPSTIPFEKVPQNFYIEDDNGDISCDMIADEHMLIIRGREGIYLFVGCSHAGIINCITHVKTHFPDERIAGVIGGMHLNNASDERIQLTIQKLRDMNIKTIIPLHCTGITAICGLKSSLKQNCKLMTVGDVYILEEEEETYTKNKF